MGERDKGGKLKLVGSIQRILRDLEKFFADRELSNHTQELERRLREIAEELALYRSQLEELTFDYSTQKHPEKALHSNIAPYSIGFVNHLLGTKNGVFVSIDEPYGVPDRAAMWFEEHEPEAGGQIAVEVFIGTEDELQQDRILAAVDRVVDALGYDGPTDVQVEKGSIFRRSKATAKNGLSSEALRSRLAKVERAVELQAIDVHQAQADKTASEAVAALLRELKDVPSACLRIQSILLVKFPGPEGPVLLARTMSQAEIIALDKFPEIQSRPDRALAALATAVQSLDSVTDVPEGGR